MKACFRFGWNPHKHQVSYRFRQGFYQAYCSCGWVSAPWHTEKLPAMEEAFDNHPQASNPFASFIRRARAHDQG